MSVWNRWRSCTRMGICGIRACRRSTGRQIQEALANEAEHNARSTYSSSGTPLPSDGSSSSQASRLLCKDRRVCHSVLFCRNLQTNRYQCERLAQIPGGLECPCTCGSILVYLLNRHARRRWTLIGGNLLNFLFFVIEMALFALFSPTTNDTGPHWGLIACIWFFNVSFSGEDATATSTFQSVLIDQLT